MNRKTIFMWTGISGIVGLIAVISYVIFWFWPKLQTENRASVIIGALGVLGTLILAVATFVSVLQNSASVEELQKDREKPIVIDEIQHVIQHGIKAIDNDLNRMVGNRSEFSWFLIDKPFGGPAGPTSTVPFKNPDRTANKRLQENASELWSKMNQRNELISEVSKTADRAGENARPFFEGYTDENDIKDTNGDEPDLRILLHAAINGEEEFGETHELYEVWENHGEEFIELMEEHGGNELSNLESKKEELIELSIELRDDLIERKLHLREEYGISSEDLDEEPGPEIDRQIA